MSRLSIQWAMGLGLAILGVVSLSDVSWAGSEPVQAESSSSGTFDFAPPSGGSGGDAGESGAGDSSAASLSNAASALINEQTLDQVAVASLTADQPITTAQIEAIVSAIATPAGVTADAIQGAIVANGGTPETAALAIALVNTLGANPSPAVVAGVVQATLAVQGLAAGGTINPAQLATGITAFNTMINTLSPQQLSALAQNNQLQGLRSILAGLAAALKK